MSALISRIADVLTSRGWLEDPEVPLHKVDEAVKAFQNWAGIPATGELSPETQDAINAPRICGLPDVLHQTMDAQNPCRWPTPDVGYFVAAPFPSLTIEETWEAFDWAMQQWASVGGIKPFRAASAGESRILATVRRIDGPNGVLAQSELPCGGIVRAKQEYDASEAWNRSVQAKLVVMHELGHALGIGHISAGNVMAPIYNGSLNKPQAGDISELRARYGPPIATPTPTPPPIPTPTGEVQILIAAKRIIAPAGWTIEFRQ